MKIITLSKIGYNHPSQANWSYGIWKIDTINTKDEYCMSYTVREAFGGDSRLRREIPEIIETKGVYPTQKITGIKDIKEMEDKEFIQMLKDFLKN
jgi:hypothetical protein